jgi:hypothetical protein
VAKGLSRTTNRLSRPSALQLRCKRELRSDPQVHFPFLTVQQDFLRPSRTCTQCAYFQCIANPQQSNSSGGGSVSKAALAGGILGALIFMVSVGVLVWWYQRRLLAKADQQATPPDPPTKDAPARAEDVLNRPDPNEKPDPLAVASTSDPVVRVSYGSHETNVVMGQAIGSPPRSQVASVHNPFDDTQSIQTTRTHGSNVIQIALVPPVNQTSTIANPPPSPSRPDRSPDLNLEHLAVSQSNSRSETPSSNLTEPDRRFSYLTNASTGSDFLNEVPMIVTPVRGQVRQVLGVVKAEVIQAPSSPSQQSSLRSSAASRPPVRSPLANTSFGPADVLKEVEQEVSVSGDPFTDEHTPHLSPGVSSTFGAHGSTASTISDWVPTPPSQPWGDRPTSVGTQADSIIADIGSATRVNVGLITPMTTPMTIDTPRSLNRMTSARLVSRPSVATNLWDLSNNNSNVPSLDSRETTEIPAGLHSPPPPPEKILSLNPSPLFLHPPFRVSRLGVPVHPLTSRNHPQGQRNRRRLTRQICPHRPTGKRWACQWDPRFPRYQLVWDRSPSRSSLPNRGTAPHPTSLRIFLASSERA